jgi:hypothetical protein
VDQVVLVGQVWVGRGYYLAQVGQVWVGWVRMTYYLGCRVVGCYS